MFSNTAPAQIRQRYQQYLKTLKVKKYYWFLIYIVGQNLTLMSQENIIYTVTTIIATIAYMLTYKFMSGKMDTMEKAFTALNSTISGQNTLINNLQTYMTVLKPEDIEKRVEFVTKNIHLEYQGKIYASSKEASDAAINHAIKGIDKEQGGWLLAFNELSSIIAYNIKAQFADKSKEERNEFINKYYPKSNKLLIEILDFQGHISPKDRLS